MNHIEIDSIKRTVDNYIEKAFQEGFEQGVSAGQHIAQERSCKARAEYPCDVCRYNPPGSGDGKPCTMCPADATERFREKVERGYFRKRKEV